MRVLALASVIAEAFLVAGDFLNSKSDKIHSARHRKSCIHKTVVEIVAGVGALGVSVTGVAAPGVAVLGVAAQGVTSRGCCLRGDCSRGCCSRCGCSRGCFSRGDCSRGCCSMGDFFQCCWGGWSAAGDSCLLDSFTNKARRRLSFCKSGVIS